VDAGSRQENAAGNRILLSFKGKPKAVASDRGGLFLGAEVRSER
jgi:hypothetical protein